MREKTKALIGRIRASRAQPRFDVSYFAELAADVESKGRSAFVAEVALLLAPRNSSARSSAHPLADDFLSAHRRSVFRRRRDFIDAVIRVAAETHDGASKLAAKDRTMPRLLEIYSKRLGHNEVRELLRRTGERYSRSR